MLGKSSDDTGIIVVGKGIYGRRHFLGGYTIHDTSQKWAQAVITTYNGTKRMLLQVEWTGGDLVEMNLKAVDASFPSKQFMQAGERQ